MSEETTNTATEAAATERVGYCQDCGKPLTRETVRAVGTGVFCEPCLATRIGAAPSGYAAGPAAPPPPPAGGGAAGGFGASGSSTSAAGAPGANPGVGANSANSWTAAWYGSGAANAGAGFTPAASTHLPNPTLAGLLGIIPGVGAMYNGQLVKGLLHLAIFAILVMMQNNVSWVFGLFVAGWILYQIFDAYHTARARRDGTPLPNLFGINDLADRIGSGQGFGVHPGTPGHPPASGGAGYSSYAPPPEPSAPSGWEREPAGSAPQPVPPTAAPGNGSYGASSYGVPPANWAGYAHPTTFAVPSPPPGGYGAPSAQAIAEQVKAQAYRDAGLGSVPYQETFSGAGVPPAGMPLGPLAPAPRRFPVGALWLIAFGVLVLVGNLSSEWRISGLWVLGGLFAGLAVWTLTRRLEWAGGYNAVMDGQFPRLAGMLRAPIMLLTLSVMFVLQAAHLATFGQTWPVFPIAFGVALFLERTVGATVVAPLPPVAGYYGSPATPPPPAANGAEVSPVAAPDSRDGQS